MTQPSLTKDKNGKIKAEYKELYDYPNPKYKHGEAIIIGSLKPIDIEKYFDNFNKSEKEIIKYFKEIKIFDLKYHYMFGSEDVVGFSDGIELNTDNKPVIEFLIAKNLYLSEEQECKTKQGIKIKG